MFEQAISKEIAAESAEEEISKKKLASSLESGQ